MKEGDKGRETRTTVQGKAATFLDFMHCPSLHPEGSPPGVSASWGIGYMGKKRSYARPAGEMGPNRYYANL